MFNFEQIYPEKFADSLPIKIESYRRENGSSRNQRQMAAEWFKLADMFSAAEQPAE
jgi:hypothetical protein